MRHLVLLLQSGVLCAAEKRADAAARAMRLEGNEKPIPCADEKALRNALLDLEATDEDALIVVADRAGRALWRDLLRAEPPFEKLPANWELRRLEALSHHPIGKERGNDAVRLAEVLAGEDLGAALEAARARLDAEIARESENWQAERERLLNEIAALTAQRDALRKADSERLATYLPALYEHVFAIVSPTDLALLCGALTPPQVANPWPEPAPETVRKLQADFRALPERTQREIVAFAQGLPQAPRLKPRAEMRELLLTLGGLE